MNEIFVFVVSLIICIVGYANLSRYANWLWNTKMYSKTNVDEKRLSFTSWLWLISFFFLLEILLIATFIVLWDMYEFYKALTRRGYQTLQPRFRSPVTFGVSAAAA